MMYTVRLAVNNSRTTIHARDSPTQDSPTKISSKPNGKVAEASSSQTSRMAGLKPGRGKGWVNGVVEGAYSGSRATMSNVHLTSS